MIALITRSSHRQTIPSIVKLGLPVIISVCLLSACATTHQYALPADKAIPASWQGTVNHQPIEQGWLKQLKDDQLEALIEEGLNNNHNLAAQAIRVTQFEQQLIISGATRWPELTAAFNGGRRKSAVTGNIDNSFSATFDVNWEIDIWGKLNATQRQAALNLAAEQARLDMTRHHLVADISNAWYDTIEAQVLLQLYQERVTNLEHNLGLIETAYRNGLNTALDVYLARNSLAEGRSQVDAQRVNVNEAGYRLQTLLGQFPGPLEMAEQLLPEVQGQVVVGIPADMIIRRPELRSAWLSLLAADTAVAIAHKNRFPRISLTSSTGQSSAELRDLLHNSQGLWSLSAGILQPLFNAGALAAREDEARANLAQLELEYRSSVLQILAEIETLLTTEAALAAQYTQTLTAEENALAAESLAFEQYQRGLVDYITVLESQRRAFDAQSSVIMLKRQRLHNRIALYLALGGSFGPPDAESTNIVTSHSSGNHLNKPAISVPPNNVVAVSNN